jgi:hypothetical protein
MLVEDSTTHSMSAPRKWKVPELKKKYPRPIHGPKEHDQELSDDMPSARDVFGHSRS